MIWYYPGVIRNTNQSQYHIWPDLASQQLKGWAGTIYLRSLCIHQVTIYCQSRNIFFTENVPGMLIAVITMRKTTRTPVVREYSGPPMTYIDCYLYI